MKISLRTYFSLVFALLIIVTTIAVSALISTKATSTIQGEVSESLERTAFQMADKLDHYMWSRFNEVSLLSQLQVVRSGNSSETQGLIDDLQTKIPSFTWVGVTNEDGVVTAATEGILIDESIAERPVFQEATDTPFIGDVHDAVLLSELLPNPSGEVLEFVDISMPIINEAGGFQGVFASHLSWEWAKEVEASLMSTVKSQSNKKEIFVISKRDSTVLLGPEEMIGQPLKLKSTESVQSGESGSILEEWPDGKMYVTGYAYGDGYENYPGLEWSILVREPADAAFASVEQLQKYILIAGFMLTILFAAIGWVVAGLVSNPLLKITEAANELRFNSSKEIPVVKGIQEVEILSLSLRSLIENLDSTKTELGQMETLAYHDALTGLSNRIGLQMFIERLAEEKEEYAFIYMDLDGFKLVNDTLGHDAGDGLLRQVAKRLQENVKEAAWIARIGGDEFLIVVPADKGMLTAERIVKMMGDPFSIKEQQVVIGSSIGAALWPKDDLHIINVIKLADQALYASKKKGKSNATFYEKERGE